MKSLENIVTELENGNLNLDESMKKFEEGKDIEFTVSMDIMPAIEVKDLSKVEVEKLVAEVPSEEIEKAINYMAESHRDSAKVEEDRETKKGRLRVRVRVY